MKRPTMNSSKLTMDATCHSASNCVRSLKVEIQVRDGPLGEALILTYSDAGYCEAKQKFCGFEWEAKPTIHEDHVSITLLCSPEVESDSWRCAALITVYGCAGIDGESTLLYRSSHIFHNECRSTSIITSPVELDNDGTLGILSTTGEAAMPDSNFTKPSEFSNACIAFKNSDMRVFVNKEFTPEHSGSAASNDKSESGDDFDVLSSRASVPGQSLEDDSGLNTLLSSQEDTSQTASGQSSSIGPSLGAPLSRRASTANVDAVSLHNVSEDSIDLSGRTVAARLKELPPDVQYEKISQVVAIVFRP